MGFSETGFGEMGHNHLFMGVNEMRVKNAVATVPSRVKTELITFFLEFRPYIIKHATLLFLFFCYAPYGPSPFFLYFPTKNLFQR